MKTILVINNKELFIELADKFSEHNVQHIPSLDVCIDKKDHLLKNADLIIPTLMDVSTLSREHSMYLAEGGFPIVIFVPNRINMACKWFKPNVIYIHDMNDVYAHIGKLINLI